VNDADGVAIRDLNVVGSWNGATATGGNVGAGIEFVTHLANNAKHDFVRIQSVTVSGFKWGGIFFEGRVGKSGFNDVEVTDCVARGNGDLGIAFARTQDDDAAYAYTDVRIANCLVENNTGMTEKNTPTGSGILVEDCDGAVVEHNVARENGKFNNTSTAGPSAFSPPTPTPSCCSSTSPTQTTPAAPRTATGSTSTTAPPTR